jgi:uncharacterized protein (TIGR03000 family)
MRSGLFRIAGVAAVAVAAALALPDSAPAQFRLLRRRAGPVWVYPVPRTTTYYYTVRPAQPGVVITYTPGYPGPYAPPSYSSYPADTPPPSRTDAPVEASPGGETTGPRAVDDRPASDRPAADADTAVVKLRLPAADAELWVEGEKLEGTGSVRRFVSPPLKPDAAYTVTFRARWSRDGRPTAETRQVDLYAGDRVTVDFGQGARRTGPPEVVPKEYTGPDRQEAPPPLEENEKPR